MGHWEEDVEFEASVGYIVKTSSQDKMEQQPKGGEKSKEKGVDSIKVKTAMASRSFLWLG